MRINDKENYENIRSKITMKNLKSIIDNNGYSVVKVAMNSKISDSTINAYINGQKIPSVPTLISMGDYLNCNLDYFYQDFFLYHYHLILIYDFFFS